jgi:hypothetical protein
MDVLLNQGVSRVHLIIILQRLDGESKAGSAILCMFCNAKYDATGTLPVKPLIITVLL